MDEAEFHDAVSAYISEIKGSRKAPGVTDILVPGERGFAERERSLQAGVVPIYEVIWTQTADVAEELGLQMPESQPA